ncbi:MAG TPA: leucyl/phenylalanyl-tRNA--protein transferase [Alkalispirochaeta sp.]|nr:leucyl/phenylalanyl-tRNA--protein transferase [Alkalispirochaeta sp.]
MEHFDHTERIRFPEPERANPWGIVAQGGNLSPGIVLSAYEQGIFPWYEEPPIVWFSPDPRFVLYLSEFRIGRRLRRTLRTTDVTVTLDHAFDRVIHRCRTIRLEDDGEGTWITDDMERAYRELHRLGYTHSVEVWHDGSLVGGLYGVTVGSIFAGESMFSDMTNGSKFALVALAGLMATLEVPFIDCQSYTDNLARFGAVDIPRSDFLAELEQHRSGSLIPSSWRDLDGDEMLGHGTVLGSAQ